MMQCAVSGVLAGVLISSVAQAQSDWWGEERVATYLDLRAAVTDGPASWTEGGIGKTRFGDGGTDASFHLAEAGLVWRPQIHWSLSGYVHVQYDEHQSDPVGLVEGFVRYRPVPRSAWRWSGRAGVFYPPVSLEHEEEAWATEFSLTPSAINSWIGEEVKGAGLEVSVERELGDHFLSATGGLFGYNDISGVFLRYRGWGLHDVKTNFGGDYEVVVYPGHIGTVRPFEESDDRPGYYLRLDWSPRPGVNVYAIHWDNNADLATRTRTSRAWRTDFVNMGLDWEWTADQRVLAQAMRGSTRVGEQLLPGRHEIDLDFASAYVMWVTQMDQHTVSVRAEVFEIEDHSSAGVANWGEDGWSGLAAWRYRRENGQALSVELLHIETDRPRFASFGLDEDQSRTQLQVGWRMRH